MYRCHHRALRYAQPLQFAVDVNTPDDIHRWIEEWLWHSEGHVEMDPVKIVGIQDWPTPKNVIEAQSFMGFINFYHWFIPNFSHVAGPLHHLTKKEELW